MRRTNENNILLAVGYMDKAVSITSKLLRMSPIRLKVKLLCGSESQTTLRSPLWWAIEINFGYNLGGAHGSVRLGFVSRGVYNGAYLE